MFLCNMIIMILIIYSIKIVFDKEKTYDRFKIIEKTSGNNLVVYELYRSYRPVYSFYYRSWRKVYIRPYLYSLDHLYTYTDIKDIIPLDFFSKHGVNYDDFWIKIDDKFYFKSSDLAELYVKILLEAENSVEKDPKKNVFRITKIKYIK